MLYISFKNIDWWISSERHISFYQRRLDWLSKIRRQLLLVSLKNYLQLWPHVRGAAFYVHITLCNFWGCRSDPRFLLGVIIYLLGYVINRWADYTLRRLRRLRREDGKSMTSFF